MVKKSTICYTNCRYIPEIEDERLLGIANKRTMRVHLMWRASEKKNAKRSHNRFNVTTMKLITHENIKL